jgi:hypothetical protein
MVSSPPNKGKTCHSSGLLQIDSDELHLRQTAFPWKQNIVDHSEWEEILPSLVKLFHEKQEVHRLERSLNNDFGGLAKGSMPPNLRR